MEAEASSADPVARSPNPNELFRTIRTAIRGAVWLGIAYLFFGTAGEFAGKSTEFNLALSLLLNAFVEFKFAVLVSLTGLTAAWAAAERMLRHKTVEEMQSRITELERMIDPNRSSSKLTTAGKTNPSDLRS